MFIYKFYEVYALTLRWNTMNILELVLVIVSLLLCICFITIIVLILILKKNKKQDQEHFSKMNQTIKMLESSSEQWSKHFQTFAVMNNSNEIEISPSSSYTHDKQPKNIDTMAIINPNESHKDDFNGMLSNKIDKTEVLIGTPPSFNYHSSNIIIEYYVNNEPHNFKMNLEIVTIGRSTSCDIHLNSTHVSSKHAMIFRKNGMLYIIDNKSKNGTFINNQRIEEMTIIDGNSKIMIASSEIKVIIDNEHKFN